MLLVVIALVVYKPIFGGAGGVPQIDDSRSAAIFADLEARIAAMLPEDAPQWIAGQYDRLTQTATVTPTQALVTMPGRRLYIAPQRHPARRPMSLPAHPFDDDKLREECGVFGVIGVQDAANFVALGLHALQHRGQEAAGIVAYAPRDRLHLRPPLRLRPRQLHLRQR